MSTARASRHAGQRLADRVDLDPRVANVAQSLFGILGEAPQQKPSNRDWRRLRQRSPVRLALEHLRNRVRDGVSRERKPAGQHLVEQAAECPDVGTLVDRKAARLLGAHVGGGADDAPPPPTSVTPGVRVWPDGTDRRRRRISRGRSPALSRRRAGVILMFAGFRSRWTMPFSCAASRASAICRAIVNASAAGNRRPVASTADQLVASVDALDELEHQELNTAGFFEAVDRADVGVIERGQHPRLAREPREPIGVAGERGRQDLDRDVATELRVVRTGTPRPCRPRQVGPAVRRRRVAARHREGTVPGTDCSAHRRSGPGEEPVIGYPLVQERRRLPYGAPDHRTLAIEKRRAFARRADLRGVIQLLDALPPLRRHVLAAHLALQPGLRQPPVAHDGVGRDVQGGCRFLHAQPAEEAQLDDTALPLVELRQRFERVVERHEVLPRLLRDDERFVERDLHRVAATLLIAPCARVVDEDAPHDARRHGEEVRAIVPGNGFPVDQPDVRLVDEGRGLEAVARRSPAMQRRAIRCSSACTSGISRSRASASPWPHFSSSAGDLGGWLGDVVILRLSPTRPSFRCCLALHKQEANSKCSRRSRTGCGAPRRRPIDGLATNERGRRLRRAPGLSIAVVTFAAMILFSPRLAGADVVLDWNVTMMATLAGQSPFASARFAAITQLAVFEAVNAISGDLIRTSGPFAAPDGRVAGRSGGGRSTRGARRRTLPSKAVALDMALASSLAAIPDGQAKTDGIATGRAAAAAMIALRANDGSAVPQFYLPPSSDPGQWQLTPSCPALGGTSFHWPNVTPFGVPNVRQFRPGAPPPLTSEVYRRAYDELRAVGAVNSALRPADRADVARFYASFSPVAWANSALQQVAGPRGESLTANARALALVNMAISDASVASFAAKYHYTFWRPETAIHSGDTDGNKKTSADPFYVPYIVAPCFPGYPSNHASLSGAAREVLESLYGADGHDITFSSAAVPGVTLHYTTFEAITHDIDDARIYGGIHFRFDQEAGGLLGRRVGAYIYEHNLRVVHP